MPFPSLTAIPRLAGSGKRQRLITVIQVLSLLATGWVVWSASRIPKPHQSTPANLLVQVLAYTLLAWAWSAVVAISLYLILPLEDRSDMMPQVLRTAATAVWFGPAMILLADFSPASLLAAIVLVVFASRLLYAQWQAVEPPNPEVAAPAEHRGFEHCQLPPAFVARERLPAVGVAFCLQAGAVAVAADYPLAGAAWLCLGTAVLTVFSMSTGAANAGRPPSLPKSIVGILATMVLAAILTLAGRGGHTGTSALATGNPAPSGRPSLVASARAVLRQVFYGEFPPGTEKKPEVPRLPQMADTEALGGYPGVILWPEIKDVTMLVAPLPASTNPFAVGRPARPLGIPFSGEYWLYRWPYSKPPSGSFRQRGTPSRMSFSSTDGRPLEMEAHQKLDTPIDINCCSKIQLEIANADRYPGTLTMELVLVNSTGEWPVSVRLGPAAVNSRPDLKRSPTVAVPETLEFQIPDSNPTDEFNEFKVLFQRDRKRIDKSARVSIERFVLIPR